MDNMDMDKSLIDERIERYLKGQMSEAEEQRFLADIQTDDELRERAEAMHCFVVSSRRVGQEVDNTAVQELKGMTLDDFLSISDPEKPESLIDKRIERFLKGQMDEKEEKQFLSELNTDDALRERAEAMHSFIRSATRIGEKRDSQVLSAMMGMSLDEFLKAADPGNGTVIAAAAANATRKVIPLFIKKVVPYISAAAVLIIGVLFFQINGARQDAHNLMAGGMSTVMTSMEDFSARGETDQELTGILTTTFNNIKEGNELKSAITVLSDKYAYTKNDMYDPEDEFQQQIGYMLAVAYIKDGQKSKAIEVLKELKEINPENKDVIKLLDSLKSFWYF